MRSTTMGFVTVVLAFCATGVPALAQSVVEPEWTPSITVEGSGDVHAQPDMATITVGVVNQAASAGEAVEGNNQKSEALVQALRQNGIADDPGRGSGEFV
jgi:uncharacterized protein